MTTATKRDEHRTDTTTEFLLFSAERENENKKLTKTIVEVYLQIFDTMQ